MLQRRITTACLLVTFICLGLSVLLAPLDAAVATKPEPILDFPSAEIREMAWTDREGAVQRLVRTGPDRWDLAFGEITWPASTDRVRAALRILDRARGLPGEGAPTDGASSLRVIASDGRAIEIGMPAASLGGRTLITVTPVGGETRTAIITDEVASMLNPSGFVPWLDARAFGGARSQIDRIDFRSGGAEMVLARSGSGWRIQSPFEAEAEALLVEELVQGLVTLRIAELRADPGQHPPSATSIVLSTTRRTPTSGGVQVQRAQHTMQTLGPIGAAGRVPVLCQSYDVAAGSESSYGPLSASIDAAQLSETVKQPGFYIARRNTRADPADVREAMITLPSGRSIRVARSGDLWVGDNTLALDNQAAARVEDLVALLTNERADLATWSDTGLRADAQMLGEIELRGLGGVALGGATLAAAQLPGQTEDDRLYALVRSGQIDRYYISPAAFNAVQFVVDAETE